MNNSKRHQPDQIQEKILQKEEEKKRKKMKVSGKSVFEIQKMLSQKNHTNNDRGTNNQK